MKIYFWIRCLENHVYVYMRICTFDADGKLLVTEVNPALGARLLQALERRGRTVIFAPWLV